jgi:hypothetical protein
MSWPTPAEYSEAIQNPKDCFNDPELKQGSPILNKLGLPKPISGSFASVYQLNCNKYQYAVRCFLQEVPDQENRYIAISNYLDKNPLPYMVRFKFLRQGIKVKQRWFPILKMEWLNGEPLNYYIERNLNDKQEIFNLSNKFLQLLRYLQEDCIAHGDLQHGNILVVNGEFRLIDYDGLYVPDLRGLKSHELGHPNYQHPKRTATDFGPHIDNFSGWVIYLSLLGLLNNPNLWHQLGCSGEERILFSKVDFEDITKSKAFQYLLQTSDTTIKNLALKFQSFSFLDLPNIPSIPSVLSGPALTTPSTIQNPSTSSGLPSWLLDHYQPQEPSPSANNQDNWLKDIIIIQPIINQIETLAEPSWLKNILAQKPALQQNISIGSQQPLCFNSILQTKTPYNFDNLPLNALNNTILTVPTVLPMPVKTERIILAILVIFIIPTFILLPVIGVFSGIIAYSIFRSFVSYKFRKSSVFTYKQQLLTDLNILKNEIDKVKLQINGLEKPIFDTQNEITVTISEFNETVSSGKAELESIETRAYNELKIICDKSITLQESAVEELKKLHQQFNAYLSEMQNHLYTLTSNKILDIDRSNSNLSKLLKNFEQEQKNLYSQESRESSEIDSELQKALSNLDIERNHINNTENAEIETIIEQRLVLRGIETAADITNIVYAKNGNGSTYIITRARSIKVDGIGDEKAMNLLAWKKTIESKFSRTIPKDKEEHIRQKYQNQRSTLDSQKPTLINKAKQQKDIIHSKFQQHLQTISKQITNAQNDTIEQNRNIKAFYEKEYESSINAIKESPKLFQEQRQLIAEKYLKELENTSNNWYGTYHSFTNEYKERSNQYSAKLLYLENVLKKLESQLDTQIPKVEIEVIYKKEVLYQKLQEFNIKKQELSLYTKITVNYYFKRVLFLS